MGTAFPSRKRANPHFTSTLMEAWLWAGRAMLGGSYILPDGKSLYQMV
jgi:hypothetical protein